MSQPAKAQEPSMEEILASIRRIIADDEARQAGRQAAPPPAAAAPPPRPAAMPPRAPAAAAARRRRRRRSGRHRRHAGGPRRAARAGAAAGAESAGHSRSDRIDGGAGRGAEPPNFQTIDGQPDVVFTDAPPQPSRRRVGRGAAPAAAPPRSRARPLAAVGHRPRRRSIPPSTRWPRPCWCRTPARSRTWCARCCGRCSSPGSTTTCRAWSSASSRPRSSASRAAAADRLQRQSRRPSSARAAASAAALTGSGAAGFVPRHQHASKSRQAIRDDRQDLPAVRGRGPHLRGLGSRRAPSAPAGPSARARSPTASSSRRRT